MDLLCGHSSKLYLFVHSGFGIESIGSFMIVNCDLPMTLPLSIVLHRTVPKQTLKFESMIPGSNYTINTTESSEMAAAIKSLVISAHNPITVPQLNILLSDLDSLEQLTLEHFDLVDIDEYAVKNVRVPAKQFNSVGKRIKRSIANINETDSNDDVHMTTESPSEASLDLVEKVNVKMNLSSVPSTTEISVVNITIATDTPMEINFPKIEISSKEALESSNISTSSSSPGSHSINADDNVDSKDEFVLNEHTLSFARILPKLRLLRLKQFLTKKTLVSDVLFQIIKGLDKLEYLELDSNFLPSIPENAFSFAGPNLKKLYLFRNQIKKVHQDAFANLSRLEILDLSQNQLTRIGNFTLKPLKNLNHLSLKNNQLEKINEFLLQNNTNLMSLDLSQNRQIRPLPPNLLRGLSQLANLTVAYCNMSLISEDLSLFLRNVPNLATLDMKGNQLGNLTISGLFAWNSKLTKLDLSSNRITTIDKNIFGQNSSQLLEINLNKNYLQEIPENMFSYTRQLRILQVSNNRLAQILPTTFISLKQLEEINLSRNQISTLNNHANNQLPFGLGGHLRKIVLSYNRLEDFDTEIGSINWNLYLKISEINLSHNKFSGVLEVPIFSSSVEESIDLDLSNNHFTTIQIQHLRSYLDFNVSDLGNHGTHTYVTHVRIDSNPIICDCFLYPFLKYVKEWGHSLSNSILRNTLFVMDSPDKLVCSNPPMLKDRALNQLEPQNLVCKVQEPSVCPGQCDCVYRPHDESIIVNCDNTGLFEIPKQIEFRKFFNLTVEDRDQKIDHITGLIVMLRNNSIESVDSLSSLLRLSHQLANQALYVDLFLDGNNITKISDTVFPFDFNSTSYASLRILSLQNNSLKYIPIKFLRNFDELATKFDNISLFSSQSPTSSDGYNISPKPMQVRLSLSNNPFNCSNEPMPLGSECYIRDFKLWLSSHQNRIEEVNQVMCDPSTVHFPEEAANATSTIVNITDDILCPLLIPPADNTALMALSIICVLLASSLFVVSVFYYRNKQTILAFIYIHLNPVFICLNFSEEDIDEDKIYDAFVSYSSHDRDIVAELIEKLEKPSDLSEVNYILQNEASIHEAKVDQIVPENEYKSMTLNSNKSKRDLESNNDDETRYKLCIHERDWLPGHLISWNIVNSVQNSKRTILILSQKFIQSIWFQVEFHTAYYQMLEDKMDRLIVIVHGELPPKEEMDKDLIFLLTTKTYLVWGEKWFWEKLYYAMPHKMSMHKNDMKRKSNPKTMLNGKQNNGGSYGGTNQLEGILKWSSSYKTNNGKGDIMQDYVDKTIANHFQLNSLRNSDPESQDNKEKQTNNVIKPVQQNAPKSLRNSGTLSMATPATLNGFYENNDKSLARAAYENKSFIDENNI